MKSVITLAVVMAGAGCLGPPASAQVPEYAPVPVPAPADTALSSRLFRIPDGMRDSSALAFNDLIHGRQLTDSESSPGSPIRCPMPVFYTDSAGHDRMPVSRPDINKSEHMPVARGSCVDLLWRKVPSGTPR